MSIALKIHHPHSLNNYDVHQIGANHTYFDEEQTKNEFIDFVEQSLLPATVLLLGNVKHKKWTVKLHISGIVMELFLRFKEEAIETLRELVLHKNVSIIQGTYYHSCSEFISLKEYREQVEKHALLMQTVFGQKPVAQLCSGGHHCSQHLLTPAEFPHPTTSSQVNFLERWIDSLGALHETVADRPSSGFWNKGYDRELLQKLYRLEKTVKATGDPGLLLKWRKLHDTSYYGFYSGKTHSDSLKNILADFEIVLIKKFLYKIKRSQGDLPFIL